MSKSSTICTRSTALNPLIQDNHVDTLCALQSVHKLINAIVFEIEQDDDIKNALGWLHILIISTEEHVIDCMCKGDADE